MRGIVTGFTDQGTIITMAVEASDGSVETVLFDHRYLGYLLEDMGTCQAALLHREVEVRNAGRDGQTIVFDPDPEYADMEADQVAPD